MKLKDVAYLVDEKGERVAVVCPLGKFQELLDDLEALAAIAERREEPTVSFEDLKKG